MRGCLTYTAPSTTAVTPTGELRAVTAAVRPLIQVARRIARFVTFPPPTKGEPAMPAKKPPLRPGAWVLLALRAGGERGLTAVQLQKSLFLLGQRRPNDVGKTFYRFEPYDYGPFNVTVYSDADQLVSEELAVVDQSAGRSLRRYLLTTSGRAEADTVAQAVPSGAVQYLGQVVPWAQSLSFNDLVRAIYEAYPKMRARSVFRDPA